MILIDIFSKILGDSNDGFKFVVNYQCAVITSKTII